jgi:hypothetical protein
MSDPVHHPSHYTAGNVETIDAIESIITGLPAMEAFLVGQVVKYVARYSRKGKPLEDLEKGRWYLDRLIRQYAARPKP